jgi:hypothetical protein
MNSEIKSGVAISVACFLWLLLEFFLGLHTTRIDLYPLFTWMVIIIPITGLYWTIKSKRDRFYKGKINFIQSLKTGIMVTGVSSVITPLLSWLYVSVVNPFYFSTMITHRKQMIDELNLSSLEEKSVKINEAFQYYNTSTYLMQSFLTMLVLGLVLSLIIAALVRKNAHKISPENTLVN